MAGSVQGGDEASDGEGSEREPPNSWQRAGNCHFPKMCSVHWQCPACEAANRAEAAEKQPVSSGTAAAGKQQPSQGSGRACSVCGKRDGHRAETCPDRKKPINKNGERDSSFPNAWSPFYSYAPEGGKLEGLGGKLFRSLKQPSYPEVIRKSEDESKELLRSLGYLPRHPPEIERGCYKCGSKMVLRTWASEGRILKCSKDLGFPLVA